MEWEEQLHKEFTDFSLDEILEKLNDDFDSLEFKYDIYVNVNGAFVPFELKNVNEC